MIPGLRIGYAIGPKSLLDSLRRLRMPWSVNAIAIEAAHYLLDNNDGTNIDRQTLHEEALRLSAALRETDIEVEPTDCNFLLARLRIKLHQNSRNGWLRIMGFSFVTHQTSRDLRLNILE